jgi:undecaprenyl-diphosphatase
VLEAAALAGERWIVDTLHRFVESTPSGHETAVGFASAGIAATGVVVALGALVVGWRRHRIAAALAVIAAAGVAYGIAHLLKLTVDRVAPLVEDPSAHSFPEGPGALTAALAVGLASSAPRLAGIAAVMTIADGVSQVALGYHWPTDVLAAWAIGGCCGLIALRLGRAPAAGA